MKKALKELLKNAPVKLIGDFTQFILIPNGKYNGFWGVNGYDNIILLGGTDDGKWYRISEYADVFDLEKIRCCAVDIPHKYGVPRLFFREPIHVDYSLQISSVTGRGIGK